MNERQKIFADEYLIDLNAEAAAVRAGYSPKYARGNAHKLVAKSGVKEYIAKRMEEKKNKLIADQNEVLEYLTSVLRGEDKQEQLITTPMGEMECVGIKNQANQIKAAELLGKRYGLYTERVEGDVDMELKIHIDYGDENDLHKTKEKEV